MLISVNNVSHTVTLACTTLDKYWLFIFVGSCEAVDYYGNVDRPNRCLSLWVLKGEV